MRWSIVLLVAACYSPSRPTGAPCDPGPCPDGLVCSPATHTCELVAIDAAGAGDTPPAGWLAGYAHRKPIGIAPVSPPTLTQFPVSIAFDADAALAATARADGADIVFTAADGTAVLPHEVVAYDGTTGALDAWVQTELPQGVLLYMYFGGPSRTAVSPWAPAIYAGVWHMTGSPATLRDSAGGNDASAPSDAQRPAVVRGIVGDARRFDGVDDTMAAPDNNSLDFGTASFTYQIWVNVAQSVGMFDDPLFKGGASADQAGYDFELGTGPWDGNVADGTTTRSLSFGTETTLLGRWLQLTAVIDRAAVKDIAYANGVQTAQTNLVVGSMSNALPLTFSRLVDPFRGALDEVRIYRVALGAAWIATEYANLAARETFIFLGPVEDP